MRRSKVGLADASKRTNLIACPRSERWDAAAAGSSAATALAQFHPPAPVFATPLLRSV